MSSPWRTSMAELSPDPRDSFVPSVAGTEWTDDYHSGGYHPVHFAKLFKAAVTKSFASLATVYSRLSGLQSMRCMYPAANLTEHRYVALKILQAKVSADNSEAAMFARLKKRAQTPAQSSLLPMGPTASISDAGDPWLQPVSPPRYSVSVVKRLLRQVLLSLDFLHRNGVAHGNLHTDQILFGIKDLDSVPEAHLRQGYDWRSINGPIRRRDGRPNRTGPRYLAINQPLEAYADNGLEFRIKVIGDESRASFDRLATYVNLQAPELWFDDTYDEKSDIWSFGCLLFEYLTGGQLFQLGYWAIYAEQDSFLWQMTLLLGPLPKPLFYKWSDSARYLDADGE
ncbi:MAG: hypothetical protein M1816_000123 [Peltula sp. TS41687]|nr:MAG: hypothetical protein M1816_000123 [Peltula sp. TS41687]